MIGTKRDEDKMGTSRLSSDCRQASQSINVPFPQKIKQPIAFDRQ
jgi:hypothetical protein